MSSSNRLATSTSPYLRQHAANPVDWYTWGPEALERAVREDRPILLSVGYSACHWCHVMAHESFEDEATARELNEWFVSIKVDREERPDVDAIYQKVVTLMGLGGGWPLTVFLTPDQRPFYGGTYFPNRPMHGRPSFRQVLGALHEAWRDRRAEIEEQAGIFVEGFGELARSVEEQASTRDDGPGLTAAQTPLLAASRLLDRLDSRWGGLGRAPKFPNVPALELLLDQARAERAGGIAGTAAQDGLRLTLENMWRGGIYDHLRGGFARYSVDREWRVPHFEKMLYDNALLLGLYADASVLWPDDRHLRTVVEETIDYLIADMQAPDGLFFSATDADSEGVEGKYFCWTPAQVEEALADEVLSERFSLAYDVTRPGNFEHGMSILRLTDRLETVAAHVGVSPIQLEGELVNARARLLERRYTRIPPLRDEKVLTAWNALLISGLTRAAVAAGIWGDEPLRDRWSSIAVQTGELLVRCQLDPAGGVYRAIWQGRSHTRGYLDDVAALGRACLDLHELTLDRRWLDRAAGGAEHAMTHYAREGGGFFFTADDGDRLLERSESQHDSALPSGLALMVELLARLGAQGRAPVGAGLHLQATLERFSAAGGEPFAYSALLRAAAWAAGDARHVTLRGVEPSAVESLREIVERTRLEQPRRTGLGFVAVEEPASAVVCRGPVCALPVASPEQLRLRLADPAD